MAQGADRHVLLSLDDPVSVANGHGMQPDVSALGQLTEKRSPACAKPIGNLAGNHARDTKRKVHGRGLV